MKLKITAVTEVRYNIKAKIETSTVDAGIKAALLLALVDAQERRNAAIASGDYTDDTGDIIQQNVSVYVEGWMHAVPNWLQDYVAQAVHKADPEFGEYRRLYKKFEGQKPKEEQDFTKMPSKETEDPMKGFA